MLHSRFGFGFGTDHLAAGRAYKTPGKESLYVFVCIRVIKFRRLILSFRRILSSNARKCVLQTMYLGRVRK